MSASVIIDRDGHARVRFDYDPEIVSQIKESIPRWARRYDSETKSWSIDASLVHELLDLLRVHLGSDQVHISGYTPPPPPAGAPGGGNWAAALFDRLPPRLWKPAYRALALVLHPDTGGDGRVAQELNDTYQRKKETG